MKPLSWINGARVLAIILGLMGASCTTQKNVILSKNRVLPHGRPARASTLKELDGATKAKVQVAYGKLPLHFEPNQGQSDEQVKFLSRGKGYTLFLTPTEAALVSRQPHKNSLALVSGSPASPQLQKNSLSPVSGSLTSPPPLRRRTKEGRIKRPDLEPAEQTVLHMKLVGANPNPQVVGQDELPGKSNYFIGNDPKKWRTNVPTYAKVKYEDVYPGVDLIYYGNQRQLEYDFVVAPGADLKAIKLTFEGADKIEIDAQGDLVLHTAGGELRLHKPRVYQEINGIKQAIPGNYILLGPKTPASKSPTPRPPIPKVGFQLAAYDRSKPLVIDPVLSYSTYLGGSSGDSGLGIAVDASGNAYVTSNSHFDFFSWSWEEKLLRDPGA